MIIVSKCYWLLTNKFRPLESLYDNESSTDSVAICLGLEEQRCSFFNSVVVAAIFKEIAN